MNSSIITVSTERVQSNVRSHHSDQLAVEEPLEIVLAFHESGTPRRKSVAITMRTPGADFELVRGFLYSEGIITSSNDIVDMKHRGSDALKAGSSNVVQVTLRPTLEIEIDRLQRHFYTSSSCGVCGKASLEAIETAGANPILNDNFQIDPSAIFALDKLLNAHQSIFTATGGTHAAAAFTHTGVIKCLREDVGRHNAMDKLVGELLHKNQHGFHHLGVAVSGRASFELLQKAAMAGFPVLVAVGAPSSLAVELAVEFEITLVGFMRNSSFNIYNRADRIAKME